MQVASGKIDKTKTSRETKLMPHVTYCCCCCSINTSTKALFPFRDCDLAHSLARSIFQYYDSFVQ